MPTPSLQMLLLLVHMQRQTSVRLLQLLLNWTLGVPHALQRLQEKGPCLFQLQALVPANV